MKGEEMETDVGTGVQVGQRLYLLSHDRICNANLPPSTELVAHRLLSMANLETGQVNMSWEELGKLTSCNNVGAARRHLSRMAAAGLIHYSTNDYVYVTWLAWMRGAEAARGRASSSALARRNEPDMEPEIELFGEGDAPAAARQRATVRVDAQEVARQRAAPSHARMFVSQSVPDHGQVKKPDKLTDKLPAARQDVGLAEQRRSVALLTDAEVGLDASTAWLFAQRYEFEWLMRHVMTWRRQVKGGLVHGSGALIHRMVEGFGATITDEDRKCALYRRHRPDDEGDDDWERRKQYSVEWVH